ncbi:hypothetical protein V8G54_035379 [Vigna mungo]|uniref:Uncharacterized protein n=1 Tax=Vigna mungo TaxID=3915 RepID=A0AAQ3MF19_VIGMU
MGAGREVSISLDGVRDKNLMQLKKLNLALFPVRYNDKYYVDALASGEFTKLGSFLSSMLPHPAFFSLFLFAIYFTILFVTSFAPRLCISKKATLPGLYLPC